MFQFELHPHIGKIRTDILVHTKGGVIKHIKAPARVTFLITRESEDKQRPVLVSAHPPLKIRQK